MELKDKFDKMADEPIEKDNMIKFVDQWMHDRDPKNAALRIGITAMYADSVGKYFIEHPYVQRLIKEKESHMENLLSDKDLLKAELVRNLLSILKKDGDNINQATRIQAAKQLSDLLELNPKQQVDTSTQIQNVMLVPSSMDVDSWSRQAQAQQAELYKQLEASL